MGLRLARDLDPLGQLFNEIDPSARTITLIPEDLISRAGRRTKAAVYAATKNLLCSQTLWRIGIAWCERSFHGTSRLESGVHPAGIKNALTIKLLL